MTALVRSTAYDTAVLLETVHKDGQVFPRGSRFRVARRWAGLVQLCCGPGYRLTVGEELVEIEPGGTTRRCWPTDGPNRREWARGGAALARGGGGSEGAAGGTLPPSMRGRG